MADSLKGLLDNYTKNDSVKLKWLMDYTDAIGENDMGRAISYRRQCVELAGSLHKEINASQNLLWLSMLYSDDNENDSAVAALLEGLHIAENVSYEKIIPEFYEQLDEDYRLMNSFEKSREYAYKYLAYANATNNKQFVLMALSNLATLYAEEKNWPKEKEFSQKSLPLAIDQKEEQTIAKIYLLDASRYEGTNHLPEAKETLLQSLALWKKTKGFHDVAYVQTLLSGLLDEMKDKAGAAYYANAALQTAKKHTLKKEIGDAYATLFHYHYKYHNYKDALEAKLRLDSLHVEENSDNAAKTVLQAETKYDQAKRDLALSIEQAKKDAEAKRIKNREYFIMTVLGTVALTVIIIAFILFRHNKQKQKANTVLATTLADLRAAQSQLIQTEKMASLGELTAGIAHEIQNPLNFVNNFSEVNHELIQELKQEREKEECERDIILENEILNDIAQNSEIINHHGKRAGAIVKGMLQHSRSSTGVKQLTDINALADEYLRLSYHVLRAKEKDFNVKTETNFDSSIGRINIVSQDIGRVLLNLINNAFYAMNEKKKQIGKEYEPTISVNTKKINGKVLLTIMDNGNGIPQTIIDKIFQPFFTTKPTGQGTGLGLSLSYDIIKAHGGEIKVNTIEGEYTELVVQLPLSL
jgi:two-component system, NtrC family, sensor kinase